MGADDSMFLAQVGREYFLMCTSYQNQKGWKNFQRPPKEVLKKIYKKYPHTPLPSELSGQPTVSSKNTKQSTFNASYPYPTSPLPTWLPYPVAGPLNVQPYPSWQAPYPPTMHSNVPSIPPNNKGPCRSPSNDSEDLEYPAISNFFKELTATENGHHYFMNYTDFFHKQGYYHINQLADESLTVEHMMKMIEHLRDGTML